MAISTKSLLKVGTVEPKRVAKKDRGFAPDDLDVRPSPNGDALIAALYREVRATKGDRQQTKVYASGIKDCARKITFSMLGFEKAPIGEENPEWDLSAEIGTMIHELFERVLPKTGYLRRSEFRVEAPDGALSGRVDGDVFINDDGYIVDFKTVGPKDFEEGAWGRKVRGYIQQVTVYGTLENIDKGMIILVNRADGKMTSFEFDIDREEGERLLLRATLIKELANARKLGPAEKKGSFECSMFCPFFRQCNEEEDGGWVQDALNNGANPAEL